MSAVQLDRARAPRLSPVQRRVAFATVLGTTLEWYDFYLFVVLAPVVGAQFFAPLDPGTRSLLALLAFVAGFAVRPLGALLFGSLADRVGRKRVFVLTVIAMGGATCAVGLLPGWASWGLAAPVALVALRMVQGVAIGGEYAAAAAYMAEHAPPQARGRYTAWLQTTATLGLLAALGIEFALRGALGERGFEEWGWRVPFLMSMLLLPLSIWARLRLRESPAFERLRTSGRVSRAPVLEAVATPRRFARGLLALFGLTAGQAVLWYTAQLYALFFLQTAAGVSARDAATMLAVALVFALPAFVGLGALSDRIGRRAPVIGGCLLASILYVPVFGALIAHANPGLREAQHRAPIVVHADPAACRFQFDPIGLGTGAGPCDVVRRHLASRGLDYEREALAPGEPTGVSVGGRRVSTRDVPPGDAVALRQRLDGALQLEGYPSRADPERIDRPAVIALLWVLVVLAAAVYAPVAATLAELFPTRLRCTAIALPYHLGNGWFGGFLPAIAVASVAAHGEALAGLGYPIAVAPATAAIAALWLPETRGRDLERVD
ncbi:MAG TPA: MFS transporter [Burkholderiaceae bacterium]|nr:MFS transporter [Burkholderiaceae bacterium]